MCFAYTAKNWLFTHFCCCMKIFSAATSARIRATLRCSANNFCCCVCSFSLNRYFLALIFQTFACGFVFLSKNFNFYCLLLLVCVRIC